MKSFNVTRSGELENTVFTILAADGKRQLARASRGAGQTFGDAERMARTMRRIAGQYPAKKVDGVPTLPKVANVRLALDIAACDNQPLVVVFAPDARMRKELEERLAALAWSSSFLGQFVYVASSSARELVDMAGAKAEAGILVIESDRFGQKGKVLAQAVAATRADMVRCLTEGVRRYEGKEKTFGTHVREGHRKGIFWETVIPVTDPEEKWARERGKRPGAGPR